MFGSIRSDARTLAQQSGDFMAPAAIARVSRGMRETIGAMTG
jgi:hypothetical protein